MFSPFLGPPMAPTLSLLHHSIHFRTFLFKSTISSYTRRSRNVKHPPSQPQRFNLISAQNGSFQSDNSNYRYPPQPPTVPEPRTLFPGGYKRPEIKVPSTVIQLHADEVLSDESVLDVVDSAVSNWVGIVVVNGGEGSGGKLYKAACLLKSVIRDRAYLLIAERVDIAAAVNASGVVVSDEGLPAIVARNTMMESKSESVVLPVVGRIIQSVEAALSASNSEGADFLICTTNVEEQNGIPILSIFQNIKIPIFVAISLMEDPLSFDGVSKLLRSGASGLAVTLEGFRSFTTDILSNLLYGTPITDKKDISEFRSFSQLKILNTADGSVERKRNADFVMTNDREVQFIKKERRILLEAINVIQKAAPLMEEVSLLNDAISQLDEPFLLVIVGEFNSGKSTVINALLGGRFLKEGVVPTTNEITFLRYSEIESNEYQHCERHPDGQYICYLPAEILKEMVIVDTPGTNVILQRQQRLTEEFVPRADLLIFVISADRPLTESEVAFLRYTQQWKKKVIFLLNKSDLYQNASELEEAIAFVKSNVQTLLNIEDVPLFPVSARSALEAKLLPSQVDRDHIDVPMTDSYSFFKFEKFLCSFLDGSTYAGLERIKMKLETPLDIGERLLSACQTLLTQDCRYAKQDLAAVKDLTSSVKTYAMGMESDRNSRMRQISSMVDSTEVRVLKLVESTLQLSNLDIAASFVFKGAKSLSLPATARFQNDIIVPALFDAQRLLADYTSWLEENNARQGMQFKESLERQWPRLVDTSNQLRIESKELMGGVGGVSLNSIQRYDATSASKLFEQESREAFLGAFGGLGAAGLSASLLTSVLPTTLEDLLALALCSLGGLFAISNFPSRRQKMVDKVKKIANLLKRDVEEAMQNDFSESITRLENFVQLVGKPYREAAQRRLDKLLKMQEELTSMEKKIRSLQIELQNIHIS